MSAIRALSKWLMGWFHDQDSETERNGLRLCGHIAALDERAARDAELVALLLAEARQERLDAEGAGNATGTRATIKSIERLNEDGTR